MKLGKGYEALAKSIDRLKESFGRFAGIVKGAFVWVWGNVLKPFGKWTIQKVAPELINILASAFDILSGILLAFKPVWMFVWNYFLKPIASFAGKVFIGALKGIATALAWISDWILKHQKLVGGLLTVFLSLLGIRKVIGVFNTFKVALLNAGAAMKTASLAEKVFLFGDYLSQSDGKIGKFGDKISIAGIKMMGFKTEVIKARAAKIKDTLATTANALAHSSLGIKVGAAITKVKAMTLAQKAGAIAAFGIVGAIAAMAIYMSKTGTSADQMANKITAFADRLADGITAFADKLPMILPKLVDAFLKIINSFASTLPKLVPTLINAGIALFMAFVKAIQQIIDPLIAVVPTVVNAVVQALPKLIPALLYGAVQLFMALVHALPKVIGALVAALPTIIQGISAALPILIPALIPVAVQLFMAFVRALPIILTEIVKALPDLIIGIAKALTSLKAEIKMAFINMFASAWKAVKEVFAPAKAWFSDKFKSAYSGIKTAWSPVSSWFSGKWKSIRSVFANVKTWFGDKFKSAWEAVKRPFNAVGSFFSGIWKTIKGKFSSIGTTIGNAIGGAFRSAINAVIATVERGINWVPKQINGALGLINKLPGVEIPYMPTISIPRLAQGGYVKPNTPQLAMIGDNRHQGEVVAPEDKLRAMAMDAVKAAGGNSGVSKEELETMIMNAAMMIVTALESMGFYVDGEKLANAVKKAQAKVGRRYNPIEIG